MVNPNSASPFADAIRQTYESKIGWEATCALCGVAGAIEPDLKLLAATATAVGEDRVHTNLIFQCIDREKCHERYKQTGR